MPGLAPRACRWRESSQSQPVRRCCRPHERNVGLKNWLPEPGQAAINRQNRTAAHIPSRGFLFSKCYSSAWYLITCAALAPSMSGEFSQMPQQMRLAKTAFAVTPHLAASAHAQQQQHRYVARVAPDRIRLERLSPPLCDAVVKFGI